MRSIHLRLLPAGTRRLGVRVVWCVGAARHYTCTVRSSSSPPPLTRRVFSPVSRPVHQVQHACAGPLQTQHPPRGPAGAGGACVRVSGSVADGALAGRASERQVRAAALLRGVCVFGLLQGACYRPVCVAVVDTCTDDMCADAVRTALHAALLASGPHTLFGLITVARRVTLWDVRATPPSRCHVNVSSGGPDGHVGVPLTDIMPLQARAHCQSRAEHDVDVH